MNYADVAYEFRSDRDHLYALKILRFLDVLQR